MTNDATSLLTHQLLIPHKAIVFCFGRRLVVFDDCLQHNDHDLVLIHPLLLCILLLCILLLWVLLCICCPPEQRKGLLHVRWYEYVARAMCFHQYQVLMTITRLVLANRLYVRTTQRALPMFFFSHFLMHNYLSMVDLLSVGMCSQTSPACSQPRCCKQS